MTGAREILLLVLVVDVGADDGGLDVGPEADAVGAPDLLAGDHLVHDDPGHAQVALGGDVDVDAAELGAHVDDHLQELEGAHPVAGDLDPDGQADAAVVGVSVCRTWEFFCGRERERLDTHRQLRAVSASRRGPLMRAFPPMLSSLSRRSTLTTMVLCSQMLRLTYW